VFEVRLKERKASLFIRGQNGVYVVERGKSTPVPDSDEPAKKKFERYLKDYPKSIEIDRDVLPETLPPNWRKLNCNRLRVVANRMGIRNAMDTEKYPTKSSLKEAIEQRLVDGTLAESPDEQEPNK
jgi:hypothetical protein